MPTFEGVLGLIVDALEGRDEEFHDAFTKASQYKGPTQ
jgi:hypothetical protein